MIVLNIILLLVLLAVLLLFIPIKGRSYSVAVAEKHRDERDTMFSRNEIQPGEQRFDDYYRMRPDNREKADLFRSEPGLLNKGARYYNRMGLLMTPRHGPGVRIALITTDAPLLADKPGYDNSVIDFCTLCKKCARVCPSASIPWDERENHRGGLRWQINQESCYTYWCRVGTDCGRCMAVCPYSHKNNAVHNFVRWGIRNNFIFRRLAVKLDDL